jgi:hypothetical protein
MINVISEARRVTTVSSLRRFSESDVRNCYPFWPQASYLRPPFITSSKRDAASAFAPGGAKPMAVGPDDDVDSEPEHVDNALAVSRFQLAVPRSVAGAGASGASWNSADALGGTHGGVVGPSTDDDVSQTRWKRGAWAA